MKAFRLDWHIWTIQPNCVTVRGSRWAFASSCAIALVVLIVPVLIVRSVIADPSIRVGASRSSRGTEIGWEQQTIGQRTQHMACVGIPVVLLTVLPLVYLFSACDDQRNPLTFDKSNNQLRKGKRVLATLSAATSIAVVDLVRAGLVLPAWQGAPQIFIRFNTAPWSIQFHCYFGKTTADRAAALLSEFLAVPIVYDPIVMRRPAPERRGFPVIIKKQRE